MHLNRTVHPKMWLIITALLISSALAIVANQYDDFEDGTTQGWRSGNQNPTPPSNVASGGIGGVNDNYLSATASGTSGSGSKLVIMNSTQWAGNYISAGVQSVSMHIKNFSDTVLTMRLALRGPGGDFWSVNPVIVDASTDWQPIAFSVLPTNLTGGANVNSTLSGVTNVRILHSVSGGYSGDIIEAQIGLDNITAAAQPVPVELTSFTTSIFDKKVKLEWSTATETNNLHFEIQKKDETNEWKTIGTVSGNGTTTQAKYYSYFDDLSISNASIIYYRLKQVDISGSFSFSEEVSVNNLADKFELAQNYPNPFNPSTKIKFTIPAAEKVKLEIFSAAGKKLTTLLNENRDPGSYEILVDGTSWASGVYYYKISAGNFISVRKMTLIK